ncbi:MAG: hypothetical protein ACP5NF_09825 [Thermoanaerobaculum sp.]
MRPPPIPLSLAVVLVSWAMFLAQTPTPAPAPSFDRLELSQGGGFTGAVSGYRLEPSGRVTRFQRLPGRPEAAAPLGALAAERLKQLAALLSQVDLGSLPPGTPGNMTCSLEVQRAERTVTVLWPGLYDDAPEALKPLVRELLAAFQELETAKP